MKRWIWFLIAIVSTLTVEAAPPGSQVEIGGTLILASNSGQGIDRSLREYERQLSRLGFSSYRAINRGGARIRVPGAGKIDFGRDIEVEIKVAPAPGNKIPVEIRWKEGRKTLIHTRGTLPLVLGGPRFQDGSLILLLDGK